MPAKRIRPNRKLKPVTLPDKPRPGFIATIDNRTLLARALRQRFESIVNDLGGEGALSTIKLSLVERFVWLEAVLVKTEDGFKSTEADAKTLAVWIQASNAYHGLAKTLGLERTMRDPWAALDTRPQPSSSAPVEPAEANGNA